MQHYPEQGRTTSRAVAYAVSQARPLLLAREHTDIAIPADTFPGYRVVSVIRGGGQGVVYKAVEDSTGKNVAVKVLRVGLFASETERARFRQEVDVLARLTVPGVVPIHKTGVVDNHLYYVMEFIGGVALDEYVRRELPDLNQGLDLLLRICRVVQAAHLIGLVHRDLKPGNVRVTDEGEPYVLDFGLAKPVSSEQPDEGLTATGQFVGTPRWAAPEQFDEGGVTDIRTDVYSLGLLLFLVTTGRSPHSRTAQSPSVDKPLFPSKLHKALPRNLDTVVATCVNRNPEARYQSVQHLIDDLERLRRGDPIEACRDSVVALARTTARRYRSVLLVAALALLLTLTYSVLVSSQLRRTREAEADASTRLQHAREALSFLVTQVSENLASVPEARETRRAILEDAYVRLLALIESAPEGALDEEVMEAHFELGRVAIAVEDYAAARDHLEESLQRRLAISSVQLGERESLVALSLNYILLGDASNMLGLSGLVDQYYGKALELDERLAIAYPDDLGLQDNLAWSYGRVARSLKTTDLEKSLELVARRRAIAERLVALEPENPVRVHGWANSLAQMAETTGQQLRWSETRGFLEEAVSLSGRASSLDPSNRYLRFKYASHLYWLGYVAINAGEPFDTTLVEYALSDVESMLSRAPDDSELLRCRLKLLSVLIDHAVHHGDTPNEHVAWRFCRELDAAWDHLSPNDRPWFVQRHVVVLLALSEQAQRGEHKDKGIEYVEMARAAMKRLTPSQTDHRFEPLEVLVALHDPLAPDSETLIREAVHAIEDGCLPEIGLLIARQIRVLGSARSGDDALDITRRLYLAKNKALPPDIAQRPRP